MSHPTRILTIASRQYALAHEISGTQALSLLEILSRGLRDCRTSYLPDTQTLYGPEVLIVNEEPIEVGLTITNRAVVSPENFSLAKEAGEKLYAEAAAKKVKAA